MEEQQQNIFIKICQIVFHLTLVFIRGTLFYLCKLLYIIFKLDEFETEDDESEDEEVYGIIDDLNHTFNFKRSAKFEKIWDDYTYYLDNMIHASKVDAHNQDTAYIEKVHEHIEEDVKKLIILAEKEAANRAFKYYSKNKKNINNNVNFNEFMFNEMLEGYDKGDNEIYKN